MKDPECNKNNIYKRVGELEKRSNEQDKDILLLVKACRALEEQTRILKRLIS